MFSFWTKIKKPFKALPLNELTKLVYHIQGELSTDRINKIFFDYLYILRIDKCLQVVYTVVRKKTKTNKNREVVGNERGLIPMKTELEPPAHLTESIMKGMSPKNS